jgi:hypothetical protein
MVRVRCTLSPQERRHEGATAIVARSPIRNLAHSRGLETSRLPSFDDLGQDALVIGHEQDNKLQRRFAAEREALRLLSPRG